MPGIIVKGFGAGFLIQNTDLIYRLEYSNMINLADETGPPTSVHVPASKKWSAASRYYIVLGEEYNDGRYQGHENKNDIPPAGGTFTKAAYLVL